MNVSQGKKMAVGSTIRRSSVKVGSRPVVQDHGEELRLFQLGVSTSGGYEAAAHEARRYVRDIVATEGSFWRSTCVMHLIFNSLRRDPFLSVERVRTPDLYTLQSSVARLFLSNQIILWRGGVCLTDRHSAGKSNWIRLFCSIGELNVW